MKSDFLWVTGLWAALAFSLLNFSTINILIVVGYTRKCTWNHLKGVFFSASALIPNSLRSSCLHLSPETSLWELTSSFLERIREPACPNISPHNVPGSQTYASLCLLSPCRVWSSHPTCLSRVSATFSLFIQKRLLMLQPSSNLPPFSTQYPPQARPVPRKLSYPGQPHGPLFIAQENRRTLTPQTQRHT